MKAIKYICCALIAVCLIKLAESERTQYQIDQQLLDALTMDKSSRTKRPFCNAFTGCGKKRSLNDYLNEPQELKSSEYIRLPFSIYKALLKAAHRGCIKNTIGHDTNEYQTSDMSQMYLSGKVPIQKVLDIPLATLD